MIGKTLTALMIAAWLAAGPVSADSVPAAEGAGITSSARNGFIAFVGRENVTTGILYDLVAPLSGIERFDGGASPRAASIRDWKQVYHELYGRSSDLPRVLRWRC